MLGEIKYDPVAHTPILRGWNLHQRDSRGKALGDCILLPLQFSTLRTPGFASFV